MGKFVISVRQFTILVILFSIGTAILVVPSDIAADVKQGAWMTATIGVVISLLLVKLYISTGNIAPNMSLVEINEKILGKWIGKTVSVFFVLFTFLSASELLYFVENFMRSEIMPQTPAVAFNILFALIIVYGCYLGLETFIRSTEILFLFFVLLFIIFVIFISPQIDFKNIQPLFEVKAKSLIFSTLFFISGFSFPMIILLMLYPVSINEQKGPHKAFYLGTIMGGIVLITIITLSILVLGADSTSRERYPSYELAKRINIGNFLKRIEVIMAFLWIITIYIRVTVYFYASVVGLAQILNLKDYRSLILPLGLILVGISLIAHPNVIQSALYNKETWPSLAIIFGVFLPILLLVVNKIRTLFSQK
ncbi:GerAB/ArcD/ProY family transporter [Psychrobacillus vulpis]|uniref:Spore gernimation protein n=1 Tax=Psychrobacillus vulpis TaxID=2325572 RepID=A0A544TLX4_9BACI|nr:endospore germination permease [Psychrobacillus vulpis]TQR18425.1 spore gernimation protein [Psychrobacillus vulpis]